MHEGVLRHLPDSYPPDKMVKVTNGVDLSLIDRIMRNKPEVQTRRIGAFLEVCYAGPITLQRGMSVLLESLTLLKGKPVFGWNFSGNATRTRSRP